MPTPMPLSVLLLSGPEAPALEADLAAFGVRVAARGNIATLLRDAVRSHCDAVLAWGLTWP